MERDMTDSSDMTFNEALDEMNELIAKIEQAFGHKYFGASAQVEFAIGSEGTARLWFGKHSGTFRFFVDHKNQLLSDTSIQIRVEATKALPELEKALVESMKNNFTATLQAVERLKGYLGSPP